MAPAADDETPAAAIDEVGTLDATELAQLAAGPFGDPAIRRPLSVLIWD